MNSNKDDFGFSRTNPEGLECSFGKTIMIEMLGWFSAQLNHKN